MKKQILTSVFIVFISLVGQSQSEEGSKKTIKLEAGASIGTSLSFGDVKDYNALPPFDQADQNFRRGEQFYIQTPNLFKSIGLRATIQEGGLKGRRLNENDETVYFQTEQFNAGIGLLLPSSLIIEKHKTSKFKFDVSLGVGIVSFRSYSYLLKDGPRLPLEFYGYSSAISYNINGYEKTELTKSDRVVDLAFPLNLNLYYSLNNSLSMALTMQRLYVTNDNLDAGKLTTFDNDRMLYIGLGLKYAIPTGRAMKFQAPNFKYFFKGTSLQISGGASIFKGDIASYKVFPGFKDFSKSIGNNASISFDIPFGKTLGLRLAGSYINLTGEKELQYTDEQNLKFDATCTQGAALLRFTARGSRTRSAALKKVNLNFLVGYGQCYFKSQSKYTPSEEILNEFGFDDNGAVALEKCHVVPYGAEIAYSINNKLSLFASGMIYNTITDRIDSFVKNNSRDDKNYSLNLGLSFFFKTEAEDLP
ncbi:MAG: hypothetical protein RL204_521 [Bacteroidota bacterium]|jgi:hypothetical protein